MANGLTVVAIPVLWLMGMWGAIMARPLWLLAVVILGAGAVAWIGDRRYVVHQSTFNRHLRVATQAAAATTAIYLTGWGPALGIGYGFTILSTVFHVGSRSRWPVIGWTAGCIASAQLAVYFLGTPLLVSMQTSLGLSAMVALTVVAVGLLAAQLVSAKETAEAELMFAAFHDPLTGLMNRVAFARSTHQRLLRNRRRSKPGAVAVLFCDLVGFKSVNDRFGHEAGDRALIEAASRMSATMREDDLLARFAGDEFVVGLCPLAGPEHAVAAAERLLDAFEEPFEFPDGPAKLGLSVGIVYSSSGSISLDWMVSMADAAMYDAKVHKRSAWALREVA